ncbi:NTP transferase domain-containing protein [Natronomonas sp. F2-12]|jgi:adenosylcobinamide-phosphate guanylyltransferase|uniref:NTP transferase domain-containing protein n=2 Tax=Natronomonas aquatica TaxID=2841590 RepID=A0A9R1CPD3_9EURY|nr:NTP transferase domain-containing protein [Natronomonas aquatica]MCQ4332584.1 NTP transferase domain-containing protein [Natronomonas aquatica]
MCGGAGTRLDRGEKPLVSVGDEPMLARVLGALEASRTEAVVAATSPRTPETTRWLEDRDGVAVIETAGEGYVADLTSALEHVGRPVLTVAADLPLLDRGIVDRTIEAYGSGALTVCVPAALKRQLGVSVDSTRRHGGRELAATGLNVVGADEAETVRVSYDARLAVNVNRPHDAVVAGALAGAAGTEVNANADGS